jgi:pyridoxal phosphate enzyme (YggS family)
MIETVDSADLAEEIDKRCKAAGKTMPVLVEINSGREPQKFGVFPEDARELIEKIAGLPNVRVEGLMTMGPYSGDPEEARPYFIETRKVFDDLKANGVSGTEMKYLSMGMTNSYRVAVEEGANMVRIGTKIFGERE